MRRREIDRAVSRSVGSSSCRESNFSMRIASARRKWPLAASVATIDRPVSAARWRPLIFISRRSVITLGAPLARREGSLATDCGRSHSRRRPKWLSVESKFIDHRSTPSQSQLGGWVTAVGGSTGNLHQRSMQIEPTVSFFRANQSAGDEAAALIAATLEELESAGQSSLNTPERKHEAAQVTDCPIRTAPTERRLIVAPQKSRQQEPAGGHFCDTHNSRATLQLIGRSLG